MNLQAHLTGRRDSGKKLLVPYVMGGMTSDWTDLLSACAQAGADAIEIGIPFSDPMMDGPVIQEASERALETGATPLSVLEDVASISIDTPLIVMTYFNLISHMGTDTFAKLLGSSGVSAAIVPDLPLNELASWSEPAADADIETILLAAPNESDDRLRAICEHSQGFVYGISLMGVTGERSSLPVMAAQIADRLKSFTKLPVLLGLGISTPEQAKQAVAHCDGVIVGSAIVRRVLDGASPQEVGQFVSELRSALDS